MFDRKIQQLGYALDDIVFTADDLSRVSEAMFNLHMDLEEFRKQFKEEFSEQEELEDTYQTLDEYVDEIEYAIAQINKAFIAIEGLDVGADWLEKINDFLKGLEKEDSEESEEEEDTE